MVSYLDKISIQKCLIFSTFVRYGNASLAAKALKLPVSKVHNELKSLEKAVGSPIILRNKHKIALTTMGERLAEFARTVSEGLKFLDDSIFATGISDINVATPHDVAEIFLPQILAKFHSEYPHIHVNLYTGIEYLDFTQQDIDVVIGFALNNRGDLTKTHICDLAYGLYAAESYLNTKGNPKTFSDLKDHSFLVFKDDQSLPNNITSVITPSITVTNYRALLEFTRKGLGISALCKDFFANNYYLDTGLVSVIPTFEINQKKLCFMSRKFTDKAILISKFQDITLSFIKENMNGKKEIL